MPNDAPPDPVLRLRIEGLKLASLNAREHWAAKARRVKSERAMVSLALMGRLGRTPPPLPVRVTITRVSPGVLDAHDNLRGSMKGTVDSIAEWLGVKDNDPRIEWCYGQKKERAYAAEIAIERTGAAAE